MKRGKYNHRVVVITGATAGVGRAVAREFAKKGSKIALLARGEDRLLATKKEIEELGGQALIIPTDVSNAEQVEKAANEIERVFGPIDVWINNAMNSVFSPITEMTPEEYKRVTEVTYLGQVYGTLSALKRMLPRDQGKIIFVGSALTYRGIPLQSAYCAAKHAIAGFYDSLRSELIHYKSRVKTTIVHLPAMNTPQFNWVRSRLSNKAKPMGKIFQPEVAAKVILYASEHNRREIQVGLPTVKVILGNKIMPSFLDWWLSRIGFQGQQTDEPEDSNRKDNLWQPVPGNFAAHGSFDKDATYFSLQTWASTHRGILLGLVGTLMMGVFAVKQLKIASTKKIIRKSSEKYLTTDK